MLSEEQVRNRLKAFIEGNESLDSLEDWLAVESFASIRQDSDPSLKKLVAGVMHSLDFYSDKYIDEAALKAELRSFAYPSEVQEQEIQIAFNDEPRRRAFKPDSMSPAFNSSSQFVVA